MKRIVLSLLLCLAAADLSATCRSRAMGIFEGDVWKLRANGPMLRPGSSYHVKICDTSSLGSYGGSGACSSTATISEYSNGTFKYHNFEMLYELMNKAGKSYWVFAWANFEPWGSSTVPFQKFTVPGSISGTADVCMTLYVPPRPTDPNPRVPADGDANVEGLLNQVGLRSIYFEWDDGIGPEAVNNYWPVTYDFHLKSWQWGQTEPAGYATTTDIPCNPAALDRCFLWVDNLDTGHYKWYVTAKLNVTISSNTGLPTIFAVDSATSEFDVPYTGRPPGCCR